MLTTFRDPSYAERSNDYKIQKVDRAISLFGAEPDGRIVSRIKDERNDKGSDVNKIFLTRIPLISRKGFTYNLHVRVPTVLESKEECTEMLSDLFSKTDPKFVSKVNSEKLKVSPDLFNQEPVIKVSVTQNERILTDSENWTDK